MNGNKSRSLRRLAKVTLVQNIDKGLTLKQVEKALKRGYIAEQKLKNSL